MTEHDLPPLDDDVVELLRAEQAGDTPPGASERVFARVAHTVGIGGVGGSGPSDGGSGSGGAPGHSGATAHWWAKPVSTAILGLVVGGGVGSAVTASILRRNPPPSVQSVAAPVSSAHSAPAESAKENREETPPVEAKASASATLSATAPRAMPSASAGEPDRSFGAERLVLEAARTAVARGNGAAALEAIARHERDFPRGKLVQEREGLRIQALLLLGRRAEAESRAAQFREQYPKSFLLPAIDAALQK